MTVPFVVVLISVVGVVADVMVVGVEALVTVTEVMVVDVVEGSLTVVDGVVGRDGVLANSVVDDVVVDVVVDDVVDDVFVDVDDVVDDVSPPPSRASAGFAFIVVVLDPSHTQPFIADRQKIISCSIFRESWTHDNLGHNLSWLLSPDCITLYLPSM